MLLVAGAPGWTLINPGAGFAFPRSAPSSNLRLTRFEAPKHDTILDPRHDADQIGKQHNAITTNQNTSNQKEFDQDIDTLTRKHFFPNMSDDIYKCDRTKKK